MLNIAKALFLFTVIFFGGNATVPIVARSSPPQHSHQENSGKFALLIGIDEYENGIQPLKGAVADVLAMAELLSGKKFGFPKNQVRLLSNREATGENIIKTFREHLVTNAKNYIDKTGAEATIYFHFSGHGSQTAPPDFMTKTDEPDGFDETLVPVDSGRDGQAKGFDIKDDEIFALVSELSEYTSNVVYVFDSCNSGTISRGDETARETAIDKRKQPGYRLTSAKSDVSADKNYDDFLVGGDKFVMIAGTRSSGRSYEMKMPDGSFRGSLSFYLERALRSASPRTTYAELMRRVAVEVNHHNSDQDPQVSGDKKRFVLGGRLKEGEIPIPVVAVDTKQKLVTIGAGMMLGLRTGSLVAIINREGVKIAEGEVSKVEINKAVVHYDLIGSKQINEKTDTVTLLSPLFGAEPLNVNLSLNGGSDKKGLASDADRILSDVVKELSIDSKGLFNFGPSEGAQKTQTGTMGINVPEISVLRSGFREAFCGGITGDNILNKAEAEKRCGNLLPEPSKAADGETDIPLPKDDEEIFYIAPTGSGEPVFEFYVGLNDKNAAGKIAGALKKYARQKNLLALENSGGIITRDLKIEFVEYRESWTDAGKFAYELKTTAFLEEGEIVSRPINTFYGLRITNGSKIPLYITVLELSNDGAINPMYPDREQNQEPLIPGKPTRTAAYITARPFGTHRIKIIVTKKPSDYRQLGQEGVSKDVRTSRTPLDRLMEQVFVGTRSGGASLSLKTDEWGVMGISLEIRPG